MTDINSYFSKAFESVRTYKGFEKGIAMTPVLRFAPSPTGRLHVGNVRTALVNWLYARKHKGTFILRMDDTDTERSTEEFANSILQDLEWLGLNHDDFHRQSDRNASYEAAAEALKKEGRLYPCYETSEELNFKRKQQLARGKPPIYDRAALKLTDEDRAKLESQGLKPHWRLQLLPKNIEWNDLVHGQVQFDGVNLSDPVLIREDGRPIYTLSSVVDDIELGVTHIFRGDDHIANTAVQLQLIEALGANPAKYTFGHMPLLTDDKGAGLSKRLGSLSIEQLREEGIEAMALNSFLSTLGTSDSSFLTHDINDLIERFDPTKINTSSPKFSLDELKLANEKYLHQLPYSSAQDHLKEMGIQMDEGTWDLLKGNLETFKDIQELWKICSGTITPVIEEKGFIDLALQALPHEPWDEKTWQLWTDSLKEKTGRKGKQLFMPLRQAITGLSHGPEMKFLLPLIGYGKVRARLEGKEA